MGDRGGRRDPHRARDDPDGPEADALVDMPPTRACEHPDWQEYRQVMVDDRRVLMSLHVSRVYGAKLR